MNNLSSSYLKIGKASDLKNLKERAIYRFFEILPGALTWAVFFLAFFLSWKRPLWVAGFIIFFILYWLFRTQYLFFHLRSSYKKMRENEKIDWIKKINELKVENYELKIKNWKEIYHLIILPTYKEPLEVIRETFLFLEKSDYPKDKMIVVLGCEERARQNLKNNLEEEKSQEEIEEIVKKIQEEFGSKFFKILITWHPANLPGEIPGHGSNATWATKKAKELIIDPLKIPYQNVIISSFDADTQVFPKYFSCLTWNYLTTEKPFRTSFQPVPLYFNNIWQAPFFSRIFSFSTTFWHTLNQERPEKLITFSSHSMSFQALVEVDFKQTNVVSDDSRIFWQCFFKYNGDYKTKPLYYPVSMDANVAKSIFKTAVNIYKQQKRWAYGCSEIPYFLFGVLKNKKIPFKKKFFLGFELIESHLSWATAPILIFFLGWIPIILGGQEFSQALISYNLPRITSHILTFSMLGLIFSIYLSFLLISLKPLGYKKWKFLFSGFGWLIFPIMMIFFSAIPAIDAQTRLMLGKYMGFWPTEKIRK